MNQITFIFTALLFILNSFTTSAQKPVPASYDARSLYENMDLSYINYDAFEQAVEGLKLIENRKKDIITLIDFTKSSKLERCYVIDLSTEKVLFVSHVAHGRNSGHDMATSFSNKSGSYMSSLGFYLTAETYHGGNGYSLRLDGLEKGVNDNARNRAVVMHAASYANPQNIPSMGRLGRSYGCPALPTKINKEVIDAIKGGSVLYIYAEDANYNQESTFKKQINSNLNRENDTLTTVQQFVRPLAL